MKVQSTLVFVLLTFTVQQAGGQSVQYNGREWHQVSKGVTLKKPVTGLEDPRYTPAKVVIILSDAGKEVKVWTLSARYKKQRNGDRVFQVTDFKVVPTQRMMTLTFTYLDRAGKKLDTLRFGLQKP